MSQFTDPFKADTDKFRDLIDQDSPKKVELKTAQEILTDSTIPGLPPAIYRKVQQQQKELENNKQKKSEVAAAFNQLFTDLNNKYGLSVQFDFDSFNNTLSYIISPTNQKAVEYYISEAYSKFRIIMYGQFLNSLVLLASQILDPNYILSESMTYNDKLDTMERLFNFMATMEDINEKVRIPDSEMKLEKLTENQRPTYDLNDPNIRQFMEATFNEVKNKKVDEQ